MRDYVVWIIWGSIPSGGPNEYSFDTAEELSAFLWGVEEASGWMDYEAFSNEDKANERWNERWNEVKEEE